MDPLNKMKQKADVWLGELGDVLGTGDPGAALLALRGGLHALRDRLPPEEAVELGAQLPTLVRGIYYEGWSPNGRPFKVRSKDEFLALVARPFHASDPEDPLLDPEDVARAVFELLARHVTAGEIADVRGLLPRPIDALWSAETDRAP